MDDKEIAERLERFLADVAPDLGATVASYRPIAGGYSRVTGVAEVTVGDGSTQRLVLRSDPPGARGVFTSDRDREWPVLQAMWATDTIEIPAPRWYDAGGAITGTQTIVMDHVGGVPLQSTIGAVGVAAARKVFLDVAAALRRTPVDAMPDDVPRPMSWDAYIDSAIDIYVDAEREALDCDPVIRYVAAWLRANKPPPVPLGIVHGDFQPGNILVADGAPPIVIDWEFTRIGDPREDIGYYSGSPLPDSLYTADPETFLAEYRAVTGYTTEQVNPEVMEYFFVLGMADLLVQMMRAADELARGRPRGVMAPFLINSLSYFHDKYLAICTR